MSYAVWVVMDPIGQIKPAKDSSFAMMLEAQRRRLDLRYVAPGGLSIRDGVAHARVAPIRVEDRADDWYALGDFEDVPFSAGQVVLMRKDPPVDANFVHDTHILSLAESQGSLLVNAPAALRDFNEKLAAQLFPQCCAPTLVTRDRAALKAFVNTHGRAVLIDWHSMPSRAVGAEVVLGDRHGSSCDARLTRTLRSLFEGLGWRVALAMPATVGYSSARRIWNWARACSTLSIASRRSRLLPSAMPIRRCRRGSVKYLRQSMSAALGACAAAAGSARA